MRIRIEQTDDFPKIRKVIIAAFKTAPHSDGNEQDLVEKLRETDAYIKELALVCEDNGEIVGHIMLTKNKIGKTKGLSLAPISILPSYQHKGLGRLLIKRSLDIAKHLGYEYVIVLGDNKYYSKFGFQPAKNFGIKCPFNDIPSKNYMAINLLGNSKKLDATVKYPNVFFDKS